MGASGQGVGLPSGDLIEALVDHWRMRRKGVADKSIDSSVDNLRDNVFVAPQVAAQAAHN